MANESQLATFYLSEFWGYLGVKWPNFFWLAGGFLVDILVISEEYLEEETGTGLM